MPRSDDIVVQEYPLAVGALNTRVSRARLRPGELSKAVGIDGRYTGSLKKFEGFTTLKQLTDKGEGVNLLPEVIWFKYISVQKGTTQYSLRGFLVYHKTVAGAYELHFFFYDESVPAWEATPYLVDIATWTVAVPAATDIIDADGNGRYVYITVRGHAPQVLYDAGAGLTHAAMGVDTTWDDPPAPTLTSADAPATGLLPDGQYRVGYRMYNTTRQVYSGAAFADITLAAGTDTQEITVKHAASSPYTAGYREVHLYRTMAAEIAGNAYDAGVLWREEIGTLTADGGAGAGDWQANSFKVGNIYDNSLLYLDVYDPTISEVSVPPLSGAIGVYDGTTFLAADTSAASVITELRFSPLQKFSPEDFPILNVFRWSYEDGPLLCFKRCGDYLYGWTKNAGFRIAKLGSQMTITRVHQGRGLTARGAVTSIGRDLMLMTTSGLMLVDGQKGSMEAIGAADRKITVDWTGDLANVVAASDFSIGASFFINTTDEEALVLWHVTGAVTELEDTNFKWATEGPNPETGNGRHAFFITDFGRIVYAGDTTYDTLYGIDPGAVTCNGTATAGGAATLTDTAQVGWTTAALKGAKIYKWALADGAGTAPEEREILSVAGDVITVSANWAAAPEVGSRYTISPVVFKVRGWPMRHPDKTMQDFGRRVSNMMAVSATAFSGTYDIATNLNAKWLLGVHRNLSATPDVVSWASMEDDPAEVTNRFKALAVDGIVLEPYIEHISADTNFELLSLVMEGRITPNRLTGS